MLTPNDILNHYRKSGYDHVSYASSDRSPSSKPYQADANRGGTKNQRAYKGPRRTTADAAAQDYCDFINSGLAPATATLARVKRKKPQASRRAITHREREARKVIREELAANPPTALHDPICYLIGVKMDMLAVKVGHADYNVHSRLDSLQTGNPRELVLLGTLPGGQETENRLHVKHSAGNRLGEWFEPTAALLKDFGLSVRDYKMKVR